MSPPVARQLHDDHHADQRRARHHRKVVTTNQPMPSKLGCAIVRGPFAAAWPARLVLFIGNSLLRRVNPSLARRMNISALYHSFILWIGDGTGLPDAVLHIHAGLIVMMAVRLISGRSLETFIPFMFVVLAEGANETMDYLAYGMRWADTLSDIANTLFWPLSISLAVRLRPTACGDQPGSI